MTTRVCDLCLNTMPPADGNRPATRDLKVGTVSVTLKLQSAADVCWCCVAKAINAEAEEARQQKQAEPR